MPPTPEDIRSRFSAHAADAHQQAKMKSVRGVLHNAALNLSALCPDGRELSLALTKLEEAMFWANAAISRQAPAADKS